MQNSQGFSQGVFLSQGISHIFHSIFTGFHPIVWVQGNSDGPLVQIELLVPIEKQPIPMVLLVTMHLIKRT